MLLTNRRNYVIYKDTKSLDEMMITLVTAAHIPAPACEQAGRVCRFNSGLYLGFRYYYAGSI